MPLNKIYVMKQEWAIVPTDEFPKDDNQMGECDPESRQLLIKTGMALDATLDTLLHETIHAYQEVNHICFPSNGIAEHEFKEYITQWTTAMVIDILRGNPQLVAELAGKPNAPKKSNRKSNRPRPERRRNSKNKR